VFSVALLARAKEELVFTSYKSPITSHSDQTAKGEQKANRYKAKIKNGRNQQQTKGIQKVNRDKNSGSISPFLRHESDPTRRGSWIKKMTG
jgi:hypothetical protein